MKNIKYLIFILICMFCSCLVFAKDEITIEKMIPVYDENSGVIVSEENGIHSVIFNDKDQNVKYNIVLKNNTKRDISLKDIVLPESPEEFFKYEFVGIDENTVLEPNSTEEVVLSLETVKTEGWGRNFTLDLTSKVEIMDNVVNPNTSAQELIVLFVSITFITGIVTIWLKNRKVSRYVVLVVMFGSLMSVTYAKDPIILPIKLNVSFESQNVMKKAYEFDGGNFKYNDFWGNFTITNVFIENDMREIEDYAYKYDISNDNNGKVLAYLVNNGTTVNNPYDSFDPYTQFTAYNLYIMADGIIYMNSDSSYFFANMYHINNISNLSGLDTSNVTKMAHMFEYVGSDYDKSFTLDLSSFDTSNVTDMSYMFSKVGYGSDSLSINLSSFDTSNVTDMSYMFSNAGFNSEIIDIDFSKFNTSKVTNMSGMFMGLYYSTKQASFDFSNFDTSKVTDMSSMFYFFGRALEILDMDLTSFDTSNVTDMSEMFRNFGGSAEKVVLDLNSFDTSNVVDMGHMFFQTADFASSFDLNLGEWELDTVMDTSGLFSYFGRKLPLVFSINVVNPNTTNYSRMFDVSASHVNSKIIVNYTKETEELVDKMIATKSINSNVVKGKMIIDVDNLSIGDEVQIENEMFNVISQTDDTITMLAQYNLDKNFKQNVQSNDVMFSDVIGWDYTTGPIDLDIEEYYGEANYYVKGYVSYLKTLIDDNELFGDIITLAMLKGLGCSINDDYSFSINSTCVNSIYKSWLINNQSLWTRSAYPINDYTQPDYVWTMYANGDLYGNSCRGHRGIRPVITISKNSLKEYLKA